MRATVYRWCLSIYNIASELKIFNPLYDKNVFLDGSFDRLRRSLDVSLGCSCGTVLQQLSYQLNVMSICFIKIRCKKFPERMCANILIAQIISYFLQMFLDGPCRYGENSIVFFDPVFFTIHIDKLINRQWYNKSSFFLGFLFCDINSVVCPIF